MTRVDINCDPDVNAPEQTFPVGYWVAIGTLWLNPGLYRFTMFRMKVHIPSGYVVNGTVRMIAANDVVVVSRPVSITGTSSLDLVVWDTEQLDAPGWVYSTPTQRIVDFEVKIEGDPNPPYALAACDMSFSAYCFAVVFEQLNPGAKVWNGSTWVKRALKARVESEWQRSKIFVWNGSRWEAVG